MRVSKNQLKAGIFILVYLFALYIWTQPFQDNKVPYGEWDAISHWELGDFISQLDRTFVSLPPFLDFSYGDDNKFKPHTLWYPPPFHTDFAIISSFSRDRMVPIFLTNAIFASSILISVFFVVNRLFGFLPGILSSFLLTFSMRDILPYIWGQWPERFAYAFIPLVLYCFYMYYTSNNSKEKKPLYLYIMSLLLAVNIFIHPLVFFHSLVGLFVLGVFLSIKMRKVDFNLKHFLVAGVVFLALVSIFPYQSGNVIVSFFDGSDSKKEAAFFSRILQWAPDPEGFAGSVPASYFSFEQMIGYWGFLGDEKVQSLNSDSSLFRKIPVGLTNPLLLLLLVGLSVLITRKENRDVFLLAWFVSLYIVLHRDLFGKMTFLHRSLSATAHIFFPIIVIGALSLPSLIRIPKSYRSLFSYGIAAIVVAFALFNNMPVAYSTLANAYDNPLLRLNSAQVEVSEWLKENTDEDANVSVIGPFPDIMQKVWWMASYSHRTSHFFEGFLTWKLYEENREQIVRGHILNDYLVFDYSDIALLSDRSLVERWQEFENLNFANHTLLYNKDNIRVYKYEVS